MGLFGKSLFILLVAVSTPLLYRQFANDDTIKFMSNYYSNYKVIDQFLKQSAGHLDRAKDYVPDRRQFEQFANQARAHVEAFVEKSKLKLNEFMPKQGSTNEKSTSKSDAPKPDHAANSNHHRMTNCPAEEGQVRLWSKDELAKFDGNSGDQVYLGFLGLVYDVSANLQHYGPGAEYSAFSGRDATRASGGRGGGR